MSIQEEIQKQLSEYLSNINEGFADGELAYLSLQAKNELQVRDKIAWRLQSYLHEKYGNRYVVRREWNPLENYRVDLAILELKNNCIEVEKCIAMVEFKAQTLLRPESWYKYEFHHDKFKMQSIMRRVTSHADADAYFVLLHSSQSKTPDEFKMLQGMKKYYAKSTIRCQSINDPDAIATLKEQWTYYGSDVNEPKIQYIGESFGIKWFTAVMIWGPKKRDQFKCYEDYRLLHPVQ